MKTLYWSILLLCFTVSGFSQQTYEYFGNIQLNGDKKSLITYRIVFNEVQGKINGYSVTDLGGEHETKNKLTGTYNPKTKEIRFREEDILYTKSPISDDSFCFVNFSGKVKLVDDNNKIMGDFKGLFKNKKKCIDGTIEMVGYAKITKTLSKINKKIQSSKKIDQATKDKFNPFSILDSLKVNSLTKDQNLNVFVHSEAIAIEIWDEKIEDGDRIDLYHNGRKILNDYTVMKEKKIISVPLKEEKNQFRIVAINEGERTLNTAKIRLIDDDKSFELTTNLKRGEKTSITILRK